ncbi:MAG: beta-galactosidase, partial [Bacteroidota bacterium]|nr:beta-galactosidase [Bacteroidota bacterium]
MIKIYFTVLIILSKIVFSYAQTNDGWWNMEFPDDNFSEEAALDLRFLNEEIAGQNGFIKLSADGKSFITEEGNPIRFWAINGASIVKDLTDEQLSYYARFLAKMGVNLIRFHGAVQPKGGAESLDEVDMNEVEAIWKVVAAMKQEGIYTAISPFWGGYMEEIPASWDLGEYTGESHIWGLMYFNDHLKNAYKKWVEVLYTTVNPYTGIALKDDPAVALIQIKNEDSLLFWTIMGIKPEHKITIEKSFHEWLISKYENIESAFNAWSNERLPEDNLSNGQVGIYPIWEATIPQSGGKAIRLNDQKEFLSRHQQDFYTEIYDYYRSLGCKQLINANNWRPADPARMFDAERWSNASVDVMAVNRYYDPGHQGENSSWRIDPDHTYVGESVLINPTKFPINIKQVHDKPFFVTESGWNSPHKYQAEGPFLVAAYM